MITELYDAKAEHPLGIATKKGMLTTWPEVRAFIFGGRARFTLVSRKTGFRFTYKVVAKREDVKAKLEDVTFFVSVLRGPDNESDYTYAGVLRKPAQFNFTPASRVSRTADSMKALVWFLDKMAHERDVLVGKFCGVDSAADSAGQVTKVEFWHEGRCCRCGRVLTVPKSVADGIGPECAGRGL
jgi:Family of unknown function (DUF6011)